MTRMTCNTKRTQREDMPTATKAMRRVFAILCAVALVFASLSCAWGAGSSAYAAEFDDGPGYADEFIGDTGWRSDIVTDLDPSYDAGDKGDFLIKGISDFFLTLGTMIIGFTLIICVGRFSIRGAYQIVAGMNPDKKLQDKNDNEKSDLWYILMTAEERESAKMGDDWIQQMLKETLLFLAIGCGAGLIVITVAAIAGFAIGQVTEMSGGVSDYNMSGIHVTTK